MLTTQILRLLTSPFAITKIVNPKAPRMNFSTYYEKAKKAHYYEHFYKSSNLKFENQGMKMLAYQFNPQVNEPPMLSNTKHRQIVCGKTVILTFLEETNDQMKDEVWNNRKTISFNLQQCIQLFKLSVETNKIIIDQQIPGDEGQTYHLNLQASYNKEKDRVNLQIVNSKTKQTLNSIIWEIRFMLNFNEYKSLCEWIKNGIYYTSGAALMIQHSKQSQLLLASTQVSNNWNANVPSQKNSYTKKK